MECLATQANEKELTIKKRGNYDLYSPIGMIPSCKEVEILGVTFQCDSKFSVHVKNKLFKANKSLHVLRTLRKEGYNQSEIGLLFNTIVLPNINYALSVCPASESDLTPVQCFLDRCFKRKYTSKPVSCLLYTSPSPRDGLLSRMPSSA